MARVVVVTGATGATGRAVCAALADPGSAPSTTVIAVGTDVGRLADVPAHDRRVADLTQPAAAQSLADAIRIAHERVDAVIHLVGGWEAGDSAGVDARLRPLLVDSLQNVIAAFTDALEASGGRVAIISSTAVKPGVAPTSSYARAKTDAEADMSGLAEILAPEDGAATVFVVRSIGEGDGSTRVVDLADALVSWLDAPAYAVNGIRTLV